MSEPDIIAQITYLNGGDPIDWAAKCTSIILEAAELVTEVRATKGPGYVPFYGQDPTIERTSHRVVAAFLDAGWTPPKVRPWSCKTHDAPGHCMPSTCGPLTPACSECEDAVASGRYCPACGRYVGADPDEQELTTP